MPLAVVCSEVLRWTRDATCCLCPAGDVRIVTAASDSVREYIKPSITSFLSTSISHPFSRNMGLTNAERQKRYRLIHKGDVEQQPTFIKMRMTGPRCAEPITEPLQAMRELNTNLNAMLQSTEQMNKVLCESAKLPLKKRRKIASSAVAQHDMHLQRLKAFRSDAGYGYDPMTQAFAHQPPVSFDEPTIQPAEVEAEDESSLGSRAAM